MENAIDRKEYRRSSVNERFEREKPKICENRSVFLSKIINIMLILLTVLLLKYFGFEDEFKLIETKFSTGISYENLKGMALSFLEDEEENIINISGDDFNQNIVMENLLKKNDSTSGEVTNMAENVDVGKNLDSKEYLDSDVIENKNGEYITAVEGINQLSEDATEVKEKFNLKNPLNGTITSIFGCRTSTNPIVSPYHTGLDIAANTGTSIIAAHDGIVTQAGENGTYGKSITIESGELVTVYGHCSKVTIKVGTNVKMGKEIGKVGMTGNATGPHLHFEVRYQGRFVNPEDVI